jgi:hypothetical protein
MGEPPADVAGGLVVVVVKGMLQERASSLSLRLPPLSLRAKGKKSFQKKKKKLQLAFC